MKDHLSSKYLLGRASYSEAQRTIHHGALYYFTLITIYLNPVETCHGTSGTTQICLTFTGN
ncbi:MAG: hypothetical protein KatS3mg066_2365 [Fischerella sp.]|nr:MAG: hypothetical protein KatS3mg066_2365 [Fischerella sp.]